MSSTDLILLAAVVVGLLVIGFAVTPVWFIRNQRRAKAAKAAEQSMEQWLSATPDDALPPVLVRNYWGTEQGEAAREYAYEARLLALRGYTVTSQSWSANRAGAGEILAAGVLAFGDHGGFLLVTYQRQQPRS